MVFITRVCSPLSFFFFFNDTATTEIYTLSLHDALPISATQRRRGPDGSHAGADPPGRLGEELRALRGDRADQHLRDRKSTRLNSSHQIISYAVFCLKKKKPRAPGRACARGLS